MIEMPYNPDDPLFLASRSLDEELSESERQRLESCHGESEGVRKAAEEIAAVDRLVRRWGRNQEVETVDHADAVMELVRRRAAGDQESALDDFLEHWGKDQPQVDWSAYSTQVMAEVRAVQQERAGHRWIARFGLPLAAAAVLALAVRIGFQEPVQQIAVVAPREVVVMQARRAESAALTATATTVSFGRSTALDTPKESSGGSVSVAWAGPSTGARVVEAPPL